MNPNDFIAKFAELFDETDLSELKPETAFRELEEWSSMITLGLIALADEEYGVRLKGDDIRNSRTVEDLFNTINSQIQ